MDGVFLLLGSNLGDRHGHLNSAKRYLSEEAGEIKVLSGIYETAPWGNTDQQDFLNQVLSIDTPWAPDRLMSILLGIEDKMGRKRSEKWGARTIDIDLLYYHNLTLESDLLSLPHPAIPDRRFTLVPLAEIAPDFLHPRLLSDQKTLLKNCSDTSSVHLYRGHTQ